MALAVGPINACPVCEMTDEHASGCPYVGLTMRAAWIRYRKEEAARLRDQQKRDRSTPAPTGISREALFRRERD